MSSMKMMPSLPWLTNTPRKSPVVPSYFKTPPPREGAGDIQVAVRAKGEAVSVIQPAPGRDEVGPAPARSRQRRPRGSVKAQQLAGTGKVIDVEVAIRAKQHDAGVSQSAAARWHERVQENARLPIITKNAGGPVIGHVEVSARSEGEALRRTQSATARRDEEGAGVARCGQG